MLADVRTTVTLALVQPSAIDPATATVVTQYGWLKLPSGKLVKAFEGDSRYFFEPTDVGALFSLIFHVEAGERTIEELSSPRQSFSQHDHTATIEGPVTDLQPFTEEVNWVTIDTGECRVRLLTSRRLKQGDYVRASGRLEVRDKERLPPIKT